MPSILVIDDNDGFRAMVREILEKEGYQIGEAANGREGIKLYRSRPADLVMIDIIMPDEDGIETMSELRREFKDVKFIMMSGGGDYAGAEEYLASAESLGAKKILSKPFKRADLVALVQETLGGA